MDTEDIGAPGVRPGADLDAVALRPWMLVSESVVATILGISPQSLRRWRSQGIGPRFRKINGFLVRYRLADVESWLHAQPGGGADVPPAARRAGRPRRTVT